MIFGHGSTLDELIEDWKGHKAFRSEEFIASTFAGFLLMPPLGIKRAFTIRGWKIDLTTPEQLYEIACNFGVGYETLITHMSYSLKMLNPLSSKKIFKVKPKQIRDRILGFPTAEPLIIADSNWPMKTIDVEVGYQLLLPHGTKVDGNILTFKGSHSKGNIFKANQSGIVRAYCKEYNWAVFVRVSKHQFTGLSQYRHFEDIEND